MESLPVVLIEEIGAYLDLSGVCALCLVSRDLHGKATQRQFATFVPRHKTINLECEWLELLAAVTTPGSVGCGPENLVMYGICDAETRTSDNSDAEEKTQERLELLTEAFTNVRENPTSSGLRSIELCVAVRINGKLCWPRAALPMTFNGFKNWPSGNGTDRVDYGHIWDAAGRTFQITLAALSGSGLHVNELKLFTEQRQCSVPCSQLLDSLGDAPQWSAFDHVKRMYLSISHSTSEQETEFREDDTEKKYTTPRGRTRGSDPASKLSGERNTANVDNFLRAFPNLEHLECQWFSLWETPTADANVIESEVLDKVSERVTFPHLTSTTLRGFRTIAATLVRLFKHCDQLVDLELDSIAIQRRSKDGLRAVTDYFKTRALPLARLRLEKLFDDKLPLMANGEEVFEGIGAQALPRMFSWVLTPVGYESHEVKGQYGPVR